LVWSSSADIDLRPSRPPAPFLVDDRLMGGRLFGPNGEPSR
jgi:hypothetical protein